MLVIFGRKGTVDDKLQLLSSFIDVNRVKVLQTQKGVFVQFRVEDNNIRQSMVKNHSSKNFQVKMLQDLDELFEPRKYLGKRKVVFDTISVSKKQKK
jgi:hypothetical protein